MRYWDTSALLPLIIPEETSSAMRGFYRLDPVVLTWWGTAVEIESALARRERTGESSAAEVATFRRRLTAVARRWQEVQPTEAVRAAAIAVLGRRQLRAADALQLGAALAARELLPSLAIFLTQDDRLGTAAAAEGFTVLP